MGFWQHGYSFSKTGMQKPHSPISSLWKCSINKHRLQNLILTWKAKIIHWQTLGCLALEHSHLGFKSKERPAHYSERLRRISLSLIDRCYTISSGDLCSSLRDMMLFLLALQESAEKHFLYTFSARIYNKASNQRMCWCCDIQIELIKLHTLRPSVSPL